jgi:hypothetical protein
MQYFELPKGITDRGNWWRDGERETLRNLRGTTPHLIYITDTPHPQRDIPSCLAAGVKARCDRTQPSRPYTIPGFKNIDPTSWLCTDTCPAIVDNIVAYRDASHISVDMSRKLSKKLFIALQQAGVGF